MSFIDSYKRLEKLCNDIYGDIHGVKAYIEDMRNTSMGKWYVRGWDDDLSRLKHYKWIRNQIWHELDCTEDNMCKPGDAQWLDDFRCRILSGTDPLSLYRKARNPQTERKTQTERRIQTEYSNNTESWTYLGIGGVLAIAVIAAIVSAFMLY